MQETILDRQTLAATMDRLQNTPTSESENERERLAQEFTQRLKENEFDICPAYLPYMMARMAMRSNVKGWILTGATGCGKTTAAEWCRWAANNGCTRQERVQMLSALDIYDRVTDLLQAGSCTSAEKMDAYGLTRGEMFHEHSLDLIIDDLGAEPRKTIVYGQQVYPMQDLLMRRYAAFPEARTYITTNLTMDEIAEVYGERVRSRLEGMCKVFVMEGGDRRKK